MSEPTPDREAIAAAQDMVAELRAMRAEVKRLGRYGRTNRRVIIFDVILSVAIFLAGGIGVYAAHSASDANGAQLALCQAGNTSRAQQEQLWDHVLDLLRPRDPVPAAKREKANQAIDGIESYVSSVLQPRDCKTLGR